MAPLVLRRRLHLKKISAPSSAKMNALSRTRGPTGLANEGRGAGERGTGRRVDERTPSPSNAEPTGRGTAPVGAEDDGSGDAARPDCDGPAGGGAGRDETPGGGRGVADARNGSRRPRGSSFRQRREPFPRRDRQATAGPGSRETNNGTRVRVRIDGRTVERDCEKRPREGLVLREHGVQEVQCHQRIIACIWSPGKGLTCKDIKHNAIEVLLTLCYITYFLCNIILGVYQHGSNYPWPCQPPPHFLLPPSFICIWAHGFHPSAQTNHHCSGSIPIVPFSPC